MAVPQLKGPTGLQQTFHDYCDVGSVGGIQITSACKNPDLLLKWADDVYGYEQNNVASSRGPGLRWRWAREGELGIDGNPAVTAPVVQPEGVMLEESNWWGLGTTWNSAECRLGNAVFTPRNENVETILFDATKEMQEPYAVPQSRVLPTKLLSFSVDQNTQPSLNSSTSSTLVVQRFAQWITGQGDPDAEWGDYLEQLTSVGFDDYLKIYQDAWANSPINT